MREPTVEAYIFGTHPLPRDCPRDVSRRARLGDVIVRDDDAIYEWACLSAAEFDARYAWL